MLFFAGAASPPPLALVGGPLLAVGLMGTGMIAASAEGRLWSGIGFALLAGAGLGLLAHALGMPFPAHPFSVALAMGIASLSFAARGALFARSAADKGWWIAIFVVGGEVAILATAIALPESLPGWLLALLPAQWASMAIQSALTGAGAAPGAAIAALLALGGTAASTLLVARLWPRRWPYIIMFSAWLALSALVWQQSAGQTASTGAGAHAAAGRPSPATKAR